jgi:hypothetical protein
MNSILNVISHTNFFTKEFQSRVMVELNPKSENRVNYPSLKLFCEEI